MILFLAGTSDARALAIQLKNKGYSLVATVVTQSAAESLREVEIDYHVGRLNKEAMINFCREKKVSLIVDASHPFAEEASKTAIHTSKILNLPYIRYERENEEYIHPLITTVDDYEAAAFVAKEKKGTILLTTGSKTLETFTKHLQGHENIRLVARMLPNIENMEKCQSLGIPQKNIIAIQGPFSQDLNKALYEQYSVTCMITKESGKVGSVDEKIASALFLGIEVILIKRPKVKYEQAYSTFSEVEQAIQNIGGKYSGKHKL